MKRTLLVALVLVSLIFGIVAYAFALGDVQTVTVNARVNPKFTMTLTPDAENFNGVDPDPAFPYTRDVDISIDSNRSGTLDAAWVAAPAAAWNLSHSMTAQQNFGKGKGTPFTDTISFDPDYNTPSLAAATPFTLQYSATQGIGD
jgi:hypothetical protein